jgi:protease-4
MAAVGAKEIWCAPEAIAGSIGVFAGKFDVEKLLSAVGIGVDELARGAHAGLHSLLRGWTEAEREVMERDVEETYRDFVRIVAAGRKMSEDAVHAVGEGRVFTGARALQAKLVDGTCGFDEALVKVAALGGLPPDAPLAWIDPAPSAPSPLDLLRPAMRERLWMLDLTRLP